MSHQADFAPSTGSDCTSDFRFLHELLPALERLDNRLEQAIRAAQDVYGSIDTADPYRGLYVGADEVGRWLERIPGAPLFGTNGSSEQGSSPTGSRLAWLQRSFHLTQFDLDILLLALAPELDRRYERIYAYLQDHINHRWPTVDLALHLLCENAAERIQRRTHFDGHARLLRRGLIHLIPEQEPAARSLLSHTIKLDEHIIRFLLHQDEPDTRLSPFCRLVAAAGEVATAPNPDMVQMVSRLLEQVRIDGRARTLYFQGPDGVGKQACAEAVATNLDAPLLVVDLERAGADSVEIAQQLRLVFRYACLYEVILYFDNFGHLRSAEKTDAYRLLLDQLAEHRGMVLLAGEQLWTPTTRKPLGILTISFPVPDFTRRRTCWQTQLARFGCDLDAADLDALADRFRLTPAQIAEATAVAHNLALRRTAGNANPTPVPTVAELFSTARAQSGHDLAALARKVEPVYTWEDIVLPDDALGQLREICQRVAHRQRVLDAWGFERKLSLGKGINVLFAGPSGAGKTMAAEIIAHELGLDLYKIDLSGVVSKYIGETEKNLARVFATAANANAILFFDEADALFGRRSEVRDAHDRYANIEISYLLQRMEEYEGIVILATNLRKNMDDAFVRRMHFAIEFPFPNAKLRRRIWEKIWPDDTPRSAALDLDFMAQRFEIAGGNIRNIAVAAAFLAAEDDSVVTMQHLVRATQREHQKMGKVVLAEEFGEFSQMTQRKI